MPDLVSAQSTGESWALGGASNGASGTLKANILLVDDRTDKLLALQAVLSELGENVVTARSGKDALRHLLQMDFAVILLDVAMPGIDGFETAELIRRRPRSEHTPIIFVTSVNQSENYIKQGYSLGAVDYVLSPIVPQILKTKVSVFVELFKKSEQIKRQADRLRQIEEAAHKRSLAEAVDRLEAETKRNRFFVLGVDMLAIANFDGFFLQLNPAWHTTLGFSEQELKSQPLMALAHADDHATMAGQWVSLTQGSASTYFEARYRRSDGTYRWLGWTAAPFASERLIYIFARDITAQKSAQVEIQELNSKLNSKLLELMQSNQGLEAFSYSISHDLRAPLRAMQCFAQALLEEYGHALDDQGRQYANRIIASSRYMDNLLRDLLEYSRVSRSDFEVQKVDLDSILNDSLAHLENEITERKAHLDIRGPLGIVCGHPSIMRQLLINLIGNAIKFVDPAKTPHVRIWAEEMALDGKTHVKIWIQDNGIGIAPDHHERIFGLFERLHGVEAYPGTGVGLALVRKGAERMGGRVGLASQPGEGSSFWVDLPRPSQ